MLICLAILPSYAYYFKIYLSLVVTNKNLMHRAKTKIEIEDLAVVVLEKHLAGRLTIFNAITGDYKSITGFQLNGQIE